MSRSKPLVGAALLVAAIWLIKCRSHAHDSLLLAYIGPGAGFAFLGSFLSIVMSIAASIISFLLWPFHVLKSVLKRRNLSKSEITKAIFLGFDGLDPVLTEKWMAEGKLPNLSRLREQGSYSRLRTTFPALSPVAWSTFATGVNPGRHNIFDFLNRDLRSYAPEISSAKIRPGRFFKLGKFEFPLERPTAELRRKSQPFWKILSRYAIDSTILRVPITFPPEPFDGRQLSAMATPDLRGTQGTFSWYSTDHDAGRCEGGVRLPLTPHENGLQGFLRGPESAEVSFRIYLGNTREARILEIADQRFGLEPGQFTPWIRIRFSTGTLKTIRGIARFLLTRTEPHLQLYVTPVEIDPENPALPISYPSSYAIYLAKLLGSFATLGMAEDTWALNEGAIDEDEFLTQAKLIQQEREAMFFSALERTRRGVLACVFDTTDRVQHMFYRYLDPQRTNSGESRHANVIEELYKDMDRIVGQTLRCVDRRTSLFVLSDHGFSSFRRGVNLNTWLRENGYLALQDGRTEGGEYFEGIDWTRTRAYTFGLAGVYLNLEGREALGIVKPDEADELRRELRRKLAGLSDETGATAIDAVYDAKVIYSGPYTDAAPDLVIGYSAGYRASWSAATGKVSASVFEDNMKCWSGDHCVDPALVPGVLFSNRKLRTDSPGIEDMAPTVLQMFGIEPPGWMDGRALTMPG